MQSLNIYDYLKILSRRSYKLQNNAQILKFFEKIFTILSFWRIFHVNKSRDAQK